MINHFEAFGNSFLLDFNILLEPEQNVYCFIGENGVGKTKLLQTMASSLIYLHSLFEFGRDPLNSNFANSHRFGNNLLLEIVFDRESFNKITNCQIYQPNILKIDDTEIKCHRENKVSNLNKGFISLAEIIAGRKENQNVPIIDLPIIFISAKGRGYINMAEDVSIPKADVDRWVESFKYTLDSIGEINLKDNVVTSWIMQYLFIDPRLVSGVDKFRNAALYVLQCLNELMPEWSLVQSRLDDSGKNILSPSNMEFDGGSIMIHGIPIQNLPTGYASVLRIIQEIVMGLNGWYGDVTDYKEVQGVVFIDEIDLHLHPKWQFQIVDLLKKFFPSVTFYITTHSPLILFKLKNGESYKLNKDKKNLVTAERVEQTNMHFIADVFEEFFDITDIGMRPVDKDTMLKAREEFFNMAKDEVSDE